MTTKSKQRKRDQLAGPEGTIEKVRELAKLLTADRGVPVNMHVALAVAVDEALAKYERKAGR